MAHNINWLGVVLATIAALGLAGLWYSRLMFGHTWSTLLNRSENVPDRRGIIKRAVVIVPATFMSAAMFGALLGPSALGYSAMAGFGAGLFWIAASIGVSYALEPRPFSLWAINGSYHVLQFTLYGVCIGGANTYL